MANVRLSDYDLDTLPDVCMKCGATATVRKSKMFSWHPPWVFVLLLIGLLPFIIVALIMTKRKTVEVPFCEAHKNHWLWRTLVIVLSFVGIAVVGIVVYSAMMEPAGRRGGAGDELIGLLCMASVLGLIVWIILVAVLQMTAIRASEITDRGIRLSGVAPEFVSAVEQDHFGGRFDLDRGVREHWRAGRERPRSEEQRYQEDEPDPRRKEDGFQEGNQ
jgi:hypothetical protein